MSYFEFMDVNSETDLHIMITKPLVRPTWQEEIEYTSIPHRNTKLRNPSGVYESKAVTVEGVVDSEWKSEIYGELHGRGGLKFSSDLTERMEAEVTDIKFNPITNDVYEVSITFDIAPFVTKNSDPFQNIGTRLTRIDISGSFESEPMIIFQMNYSSSTIKKGDVDFDGKIDAIDASLVLAEYRNIQTGGEPTFTPEQMIAADMDNDGHIDSTDASEILRIYTEQQTGGRSAEIPTNNVTITTNGEDFIVGVPDEVIVNGYLVTVDSERKVVYYQNDYDKQVNITMYSKGNFPLLSVGENYVKYNGDCAYLRLKKNERWL